MATVDSVDRTIYAAGKAIVFILAALRPLVHGVLRLIAIGTLISAVWMCVFHSPPVLQIVGMMAWAAGAVILSWAYGYIVTSISRRGHLEATPTV